MDKKTLTKIAISVALISPLFVYAADVVSVLTEIDNILRLVIPILMILATVVFLWGIIRWITAGGEEDKLKEGRQLIISGLLGLFIMVAIWAVVRALVSQFGLGGGTIPPGPGDIRP